jgi:hypothetical protein
MLFEALFATVENQKQPLVGGWLNKLHNIYTRED